MLYGCPGDPALLSLWEIVLTECYLVHTTCKDEPSAYSVSDVPKKNRTKEDETKRNNEN